MSIEKLTSFDVQGRQFGVIYVESIKVLDTQGVTCHIYKFEGDNTRDLAIIEIEPACHTPLQKVLSGDKTFEGYLTGKGSLSVSDDEGKSEMFPVDENTSLPFIREVKIGEKMQWQANKESTLLVYEICYPPYRDGRFQTVWR